MRKWWKILFWAVIIIALVIAAILAFSGGTAEAATNVSSTNRYAWDDVDAWWDFYTNDSVVVRSRKLDGYADSSVGPISLDCATSPNGNVCGTVEYGICNGPGPHYSGIYCPSADPDWAKTNGLTGYAWNDNIGWISFNCDQSTQGGSNTCGTSNYKVLLDGGTGIFSGFAWNDIVGWISFNCDQTGQGGGNGCGTSNYELATSWQATSTVAWLESSTFDTQNQNGAILNSITWRGSQPVGTCVKFQIAVATSSGGPWPYYGTSQDINTYFGNSCPGPDSVIPITGSDRSWVNNMRYLRYKIFLSSDILQTLTPRVDDVILNWSR
jgi:hypothetical protein